MDGCAMCEGEHKSCDFTAIKMILRKLSWFDSCVEYLSFVAVSKGFF